MNIKDLTLEDLLFMAYMLREHDHPGSAKWMDNPHNGTLWKLIQLHLIDSNYVSWTHPKYPASQHWINRERVHEAFKAEGLDFAFVWDAYHQKLTITEDFVNEV